MGPRCTGTTFAQSNPILSPRPASEYVVDDDSVIIRADIEDPSLVFQGSSAGALFRLVIRNMIVQRVYVDANGQENSRGHASETLKAEKNTGTSYQHTIWNLVKSVTVWPDTNTNNLPPHYGVLLGCGNISPPTTNNDSPTATKRGIARLKKILLSESTYLIWVLRCEKVIGGTSHSKRAITSRWLHLITSRLEIDRRLAKSNRKQHSKNKVSNTWTPILRDKNSLSPDWVTNLEVLVGINLPRPPDDTGDTR